MLGNIVFRDCVVKPLNECSIKTFTVQDIRVKVCYNSCSDDGCNNESISASGRASRTFIGSVTAARSLIGLVVYTISVA